MGATATARGADLAKMAQGAGVQKAATITSNEDFAFRVKPALEAQGLSFFVLKSESGRAQVKVDTRLIHGRPMLERFISALLSHPDYRGKSMRTSRIASWMFDSEIFPCPVRLRKTP